MNINKPLIVASLVVLAASPAFAAYNHSTYMSDRQQTLMTTSHVNDQVLRSDAVLNQNTAVNDNCTINWQDRIFVGGLINVDGIWTDRSPALLRGAFTDDGDSTDLTVNNANLFVDAKVNNWVKVHTNVMYAEKPEIFATVTHATLSTTPGEIVIQPSGLDVAPIVLPATIIDTTENVFFGVDKNRKVSFDEAFIDINNFAQSPFFLRAGKQYVAFGDYPNYPILQSMTQMMTQTNQTALSVGAISDFGPYLHLFAFNGVRPSDETSSNIKNFGAKLGWYNDLSSMGMNGAHFNADVSWMRNIWDADAFTNTLNASNFSQWNIPSLANMQDRVGGVAAHVDFSYNSFDLWANYSTAVRHMLSDSEVALLPLAALAGVGVDTSESSQLWAADINGSYAFRVCNYESKFGLSYQFAGHGQFLAMESLIHSFPTSTLSTYNGAFVVLNNTVNFNDPFPLLGVFPKNRFTADFSISPMKNTSITALYAHNESFGYITGSRDSNVGIIRLGVNF